MYCVKCGVRLQDGVEKCPLCGLPAWKPEGAISSAERVYPDELPPTAVRARRAVLAIFTVVLAAACLSSLIGCLKIYGSLSWSGFVLLGSATLYVIALLPLWFKRSLPLLFVPLDFAVVGGFLLYICEYTDGDWFLSFAFPSVGMYGLLTTVAVALYRYIRGRRLLITGVLLITMGCSMMLMEFFAHITFGASMFNWSLYPVTACSMFGVFMIVAGLVPSLRNELERRFFL